MALVAFYYDNFKNNLLKGKKMFDIDKFTGYERLMKNFGGVFEIRTKEGTPLQYSRFNLTEIACGFAEVLESRLNAILSFNF